MKARVLMIAAAVGAGLALVLYLRRQASAAVDAIADPIARVIAHVTSDEPIQALGHVVLPDGRRVPLTGLSVRFDALDRAVFGFEGM